MLAFFAEITIDVLTAIRVEAVILIGRIDIMNLSIGLCHTVRRVEVIHIIYLGSEVTAVFTFMHYRVEPDSVQPPCITIGYILLRVGARSL